MLARMPHSRHRQPELRPSHHSVTPQRQAGSRGGSGSRRRGCGALLVMAATTGCVPEGPATGTDPAASASAAVARSGASGRRRAAAGAGPQLARVKKKTPRLLQSARNNPLTSRDGAPDPPLHAPFEDTFERAALGPRWRALSRVWHIQGGALCAAGAHNRGVWLRRRLPTNATISFDATSYAPEGDIKVELWGDGYSGARSMSYHDASGYIVIFGGWKNHLHVLARLDEHKSDRKWLALVPGADTFRTRPVATGRRYHFELQRRDGRTLKWSVDGHPIHEFVDNKPLTGAGHDHFGFNDWTSHVCFDNLRVTTAAP